MPIHPGDPSDPDDRDVLEPVDAPAAPPAPPSGSVAWLAERDGLRAEVERLTRERDEARKLLKQCWDAAGLLGSNWTGIPEQAWEVPSDLVDQIYDLSSKAANAEEAEEEVETLKRAIVRAIESAEEETVDRYRGTDEPRAFVTILRSAAGLSAPDTSAEDIDADA